MSRTALLYVAVIAIVATICPEAGAVLPGDVRWHNEAADTTRITDILVRASSDRPTDSGDLIVMIGREFEGTPYVASTLEGEPEQLTVNLEGLDCTTFVENVLALALTVGEGRTAWQDFIYNLGNIRYRQGRVDGYTSRLHYISDWIVDNTHRGNITEVTGRMPGTAYAVKTLDYMTKHRSAYQALTDQAEFERMKNCEIGYRSHRFPYIRSGSMTTKWAKENLKNGDILAFTTKVQGLDVSHMGIVVMEADGPHLLHASSKAGRVIVDQRTLQEYLKKNPNITGARVIRPVH